jgi:hypothetical protein
MAIFSETAVIILITFQYLTEKMPRNGAVLWYILENSNEKHAVSTWNLGTILAFT